jgi:hypothetical protein
VESDERQHTDSQVLRRYFGKAWRSWWWVRRQFTATSLTTIGAIVIGGGGWILTLKTRVVVLETQVVPVLKSEDRLAHLEVTAGNQEGRLSAVERDLEWARQHAGDAPAPKGRKR